MAGETTITIIGNLTRDPELAFTDSGVAYARFTVASTPRRYDASANEWSDDKDKSLFLRCTAWRQLAEHINESLSKGARVIVAGRLKLRTWQTDDGENRQSMELDVDEVGPSLRYATARVAKMTRSQSTPPPPDSEDPWAGNRPAAAGAAHSDGYGAEPPF
jgi:single-strand DNA-binding protein